MRSSAASWSTRTLFVSGSRLPFAMSDSSRSSRKMMSIGRPSDGDACASDGAVRSRGLSHPRSGRGSRRGGPGRERRQRGRRDHRRDVAAELGDLLDQARAHVALLERGHEEDRVDVGREHAVVVGELDLGLEVGDRAQAADDRAGAVRRGRSRPSGRRTSATSTRPASIPAVRRRSAARMIATRRSASQQRRLARVPRTATTTRSKTAAARPMHVEMAVRDGVEGAGIDRDARPLIRPPRRCRR